MRMEDEGNMAPGNVNRDECETLISKSNFLIH